ncbi:hypothetical protein [Bradyrhizobium liaoningense]|uniref:hypothetical protein n=1 Tax=Bradyrhizobium liaoningense TaxID=43992 RepID=UPI001BA69CC5|nr:hypothetical protein [Bradyrhizobium liaoningense]MBR0713081.1 hypothetical protein [Bradyrhizobium liaoningense]
MNSTSKAPFGSWHSSESHRLCLLICLHIAVLCLTLILVARYDRFAGSDPHVAHLFYPPAFHIFFDADRLHVVVPVIAVFACLSGLFVTARFSFGFFAGFYFYTMIFGYLWLNSFSDLSYNHGLARLSAMASLITFLLPALFVSSPLHQRFVLSTRAFDRMLMLIFLVGVVVVVLGAAYNFRLVALADIYQFRDQISAPKIVNYLVTIVSTVLLPFAFAGFLARKAYWWAVAVLLVLPFLYPVTLSKTAFFTPIWLVAMLLVSRLFEARVAVILSLFVPMFAGVMLFLTLGSKAGFFFHTIELRQITIPALAMDIYNDFFSRHDLTYFCQISFLKPIMRCPYQEQLSVLLEGQYGLGNYNASLFATEGIASVGPLWAPVVTFACGLVFALGNRLSSGLPPEFILISGAILPQILLNVPLSTTLLSHGMGLIFLLWYLTPRAISESDRSNAALRLDAQASQAGAEAVSES